VFLVLIILLAIIVFLSVDKGAVEISLGQCAAIVARRLGFHLPFAFDSQQEATLLSIRLPRVVLGLMVGAALGISGTAMQGLFRNPLADPSLIGISSGAALAATIVIVVGDLVAFNGPTLVRLMALPVAAFAGGLVTTVLVYRLATIAGQTIVATLLLAGIAINALSQAFSGLVTYFATDTQIRSITFWKLGSLGGATWNSVLIAGPFILIPIALFPILARDLNALLLGEAEAGHLGVNAERVKRLSVIFVAMAVGAAVAVSGIITFVGLVVPHVLRLILGPDHGRLLPASALLGAILLLASDLVARTLVAPAELPIGILTALIGAPFFIWLLLRDRKWRVIH
jgi:iron complex transport system permease protein